MASTLTLPLLLWTATLHVLPLNLHINRGHFHLPHRETARSGAAQGARGQDEGNLGAADAPEKRGPAD